MNDDYPDLPEFLDRKKNKIQPIKYVPIQQKITKEENTTKQIFKPPPPPPQIKIQAKINSIIATIEGMIDDNKIDENWSAYNFLLVHDASLNVAQAIVDTYTPRAEEWIEVLNAEKEGDEDLQYAYRCYSRDEMKKIAMMYASLVEDAQQYIDNRKRGRKTVRKRRIRVEKVIKYLQYAQKYEPYKLVSIDPAKIIGASELWTFNTTNMVVTVYRAAKNRHLTLQRSNVIDWDPDTSMGKRTGRNVEEVVKFILESSRRDLSKLMSVLKSEATEPKRITGNTILLRVF